MVTVFRTLVFVASITAWASADAAEYRCQKLDSSLRIAVEVKKAGHTLPCEVVAEDDRGERAVLYRARYDREYCPTRIEKTRAELEQEGWACRKTSEDNVVRASEDETGTLAAANNEGEDREGSGGALVTPDGSTITASRQCRLDGRERAIRIEVEDPESGKPCALVYWDDGDWSRPGEVLWRAVHDADFCPTRFDTILAKWTGEGWACDDAGGVSSAALTTPAAETPETAAEPAVEAVPSVSGDGVDRALEEIVGEDAQRIGEWMQVDPAIEIAARGDLNDDGSEDAVVILAYQSEHAAYRQYLMSYLGAGDGYELASVKLLTGVEAPPANARVEQIDKGVIWLTMPGADGTAPAPTGYQLRDQQLVEVDASPPPALTGN